MTTPLSGLRAILRKLKDEVEVLPAVGGAAEDLEEPDIEEREDAALSGGERVFDTIFERDPSVARPPLYRHVPPIGRSQQHLFRYFLDGSFRSYFLGTLIEHERHTPLHYAQVGACALWREKDGTVRRQFLEVRHLILAGKGRLAKETWDNLQSMAQTAGITLVDLTEDNIPNGVMSDLDLRSQAKGQVRQSMHALEGETIKAVLPQTKEDCWLITDGSLAFSQSTALLTGGEQVKPVIGVAKNFRKDPQFVYGRGPAAQRYSIFQLLSNLQVEHRTVAYSAHSGNIAFWYVRLREQKNLDYPMMGVVKVEMVSPDRSPVPSELVDLVSRALVAERCVTPHGADRRWHAHLYPIFLAERAVKENLLGFDVVQQYLKWR